MRKAKRIGFALTEGVTQPKKPSVQFENGEVLTLSAWQFCHPTHAQGAAVSSRAVKDVQRALDAIRSELDGANWQTRLEALQVMLAASEQIVAMARKLDPPKRKPTKRARPSIKRTPPKPNSTSPTSAATQTGRAGADRSLAPIKPVPPLANQRD